MALADWYIDKRIENPSTPAAWSKSGPELEADEFDLEVFSRAIFHPDGKTVTLKDGQNIVKIRSRKTPWKTSAK